MSTFRILNQAPTYLTNAGQVNAGGSLTFTEVGLSTLKNTWADKAKTTLNANPVVMDANGRTGDVWGDGAYDVTCKDAAGVTLWTRPNVEIAGDAGQVIPALEDGKYLYTDGTVMLWVDVILPPDPDGLDEVYLVVIDGVYTLIPIPEPPEPPTPEYDVSTNYIRIGTLLDQWGEGEVPAAPGDRSASVNIVWDEEFSGVPYHCGVEISNAGGSTSTGAICTHAVTNLTATGCTVTVNMPDDDSQASWDLNNPTPFTFRVVGPTTLPA